MTVSMVVRRKAGYKDARRCFAQVRLLLLRRNAGQILVIVGYPDVATRERAMQNMSHDADWQRVSGDIQKIVPLQEMYLTVITERQ